MSANIYGLTSLSIVPGPDLFLTRDPEGKTTARRSFTVLKNALASGYIQSKLAKGTKITTLCDDIPPDFQDLEIDSFDSQDNPGGMTTVTVSFTGYIDPEGSDFDFDREITYSLRGATSRRPLTEHPNFIKDMEATNEAIGRGLAGIINGTAYGRGTSTANYQIIQSQPLSDIIGKGAWISNANNNAWWDIIVKKGLREWDSATFEWTRSTSNAGGLSNADIAKLGKADTPPGGPPTPEEEGFWQMVDLSDERSSNVSSNSLAWRFVFGVKIPKIHDFS